MFLCITGQWGLNGCFSTVARSICCLAETYLSVFYQPIFSFFPFSSLFFNFGEGNAQQKFFSSIRPVWPVILIHKAGIIGKTRVGLNFCSMCILLHVYISELWRGKNATQYTVRFELLGFWTSSRSLNPRTTSSSASRDMRRQCLVYSWHPFVLIQEVHIPTFDHLNPFKCQAWHQGFDQKNKEIHNESRTGCSKTSKSHYLVD